MARNIPLPPSAACLSASMRDLGYSLEAAVADLIDNSISADATTVDIFWGLPHFVWRSDNWMGIIRALRSSAPARPYIARLIVFSRLI